MKKPILSFVVSACIVFSLVGAERGVVLQEGVLEEFYRKKTEQTRRYHSAIFEKVLPLVQAVCGYLPAPNTEINSDPSFCLNKLENAHEIIQQFENVRLKIQIDSEKTEFAGFSFQLMEELILLLEPFMTTDLPEILYKHVKCLCMVCAYLLRFSIIEDVLHITRLKRCLNTIKSLIRQLKGNSYSQFLYYAAYLNALRVKISLYSKLEKEEFSLALTDEDFLVFPEAEFQFFSNPQFQEILKNALETWWISSNEIQSHQYILNELKKVSEFRRFDIAPPFVLLLQ